MRLGGVQRRIAWVDLTSREVAYERPSGSVYGQYLGGYGVGAYYLFTRQPAAADPLGPEATLGFVTGPLTGTPAITGSRFTVVGKSPKTGGWGDANAGGRFGPALKQAGLDALFVTGSASAPAYLLVNDGTVTIRDATDLWGCLVVDTESRLRREHGAKARSAVIGPVGEAVRALAAIMTDGGRAAARSGLGMVMGAKRLKAVVAVGSGVVPLARGPQLEALRGQLVAEYCNADNPVWVDYHTYGTNSAFEFLVEEGDTPVRNYAGSTVDFRDSAKLGGEAVKSLISRRYACWRCPIGCGGYVELPEGPYGGRGHKPEYETVSAFGPNCLNSDLEAICRINHICNEYGMDTMSTGMTLSFAMECYENGHLTQADLGGAQLTWGNAEAMVRVVELIARGEGPAAELLGDGVRRASERLGGETAAFAMECGGEELSQHDPRCYPGIAASNVADATPARHTQGGSWFAESLYIPVDSPSIAIERYSYAGKGATAAYFSHLYHAVNMAGLCQFSPIVIPSAVIPTYLSLAMGVDFSMEDLLEMGQRAATLRIAFNLREGIRNRDAYRMPSRALGVPPLEAGPTRGVTVDNDTQLRDYYEAVGWDPETGVPARATLERLGLGFALDVVRGDV
jgi:aldehyde:ferredoxin oxidoreductase